jgi:hypothetical protein
VTLNKSFQPTPHSSLRSSCVAAELSRWASPMKMLVGLALLGLSTVAFPCTVPPPKLFRDPAALVNEASAIVIVEAVAGKASKDKACQLRVVRTLKGNNMESIPIACHLPGTGDWMTHFSAHSEIEFWQRRGGRLGINGDCTVIPPAFEVGHSYLVLLGVSPDTKQFEEIAGSTDKWLIYVEQQLSQGK